MRYNTNNLTNEKFKNEELFYICRFSYLLMDAKNKGLSSKKIKKTTCNNLKQDLDIEIRDDKLSSAIIIKNKNG